MSHLQHGSEEHSLDEGYGHNIVSTLGDTRNSAQRKLLLRLTQVTGLGILRRIREVKKAKDSDRQSDDTIFSSQPYPSIQSFVLTNDEHPLPALQTSHASHTLMNSSHHHTSEHSTNLTRHTEKGSSLLDFFRLVPRANDVHCTRVCACFCQAEEEAEDAELGDIFDCGTEHCHGGPEHDHGREPNARLDFLDDDTVGELANCHSRRVRGGLITMKQSTYPAVVTERTLL